MLELSDIRKSYRIGPTEIEILKGVNLKVVTGELMAIMGPSGCGKSTLMNILGLLDKPTSGTYAIMGTPVTYTDDDNLSRIRNRSIGFVFQQYHLLPRLSALDNVGLPLIYRGEREQEIRTRSLEYLKKVNMHERASHNPTELSGGQQQRVAIARAIAGRPSLILADEPTGALDTKVGQEIMDLFRRLNEEEGITVVIITHDPGIAKQCKRFVYMKDGTIIEQ
ncbi:MAG: ABC transporter ATP-binding protein [Nitrospirae bacterium]|nr:ABC transporter ATP-binding protein [Nitrospirota bacterium]